MITTPTVSGKPGEAPCDSSRWHPASHRQRAGRSHCWVLVVKTSGKCCSGGCASRPAACPDRWQARQMLQVLGVIIDCPDPRRLAAFYCELTGRDLMEGSSDTSAGISLGEVGLTFARVDGYRPPRWPDDEHPKQYHLDFEVDLIEDEQRRVVELGATLQKDFIGPDGYGWQVYTDPAGHPFCLCRHKAVTWINKRMVLP